MCIARVSWVSTVFGEGTEKTFLLRCVCITGNGSGTTAWVRLVYVVIREYDGRKYVHFM